MGKGAGRCAVEKVFALAMQLHLLSVCAASSALGAASASMVMVSTTVVWLLPLSMSAAIAIAFLTIYGRFDSHGMVTTTKTVDSIVHTVPLRSRRILQNHIQSSVKKITEL